LKLTVRKYGMRRENAEAWEIPEFIDYKIK
jgi:hypothetical protein